jgi:hypothetical protein
MYFDIHNPRKGFLMTYKTAEERAAYARKWRAKNQERAREIDKKKRDKKDAIDPGWNYRAVKAWRENNPEKLQAQSDRAVAQIKADPVRRAHQRKKQQEWADRPEVRARHRVEWKETAAQKRAADPEYWARAARAGNYRKNYGITIEQYDAMVLAQDGKCAICRTDKPGGKGKYWHVDHCHDRDQVRELLCHGCNTGMGAFKDNPELLRAAAAYLERHRQP